MQQGFMHQYGHYAWGIDYYNKMIPHNAPVPFHVYDWHRNESPIREEGYSTDLIAAEFERVIRRVRDGHLGVPLNAMVSCYGGQPAEAVLRGMYYAGKLERKYDLRIPLAVAMENNTLPWCLASPDLIKSTIS